ncbi:MAG: MBOAT family protein [Ruminococcus sp.]|nr:MBOAT family protein [Ruminococcus sp.]
MTYTSVSFLFFTLGCLLLYYCTPKKKRWGVLLAASLGFYGIVCYKNLWFMAFLVMTAATTYGGARLLGNYITKTDKTLKENKKTWEKAQKDAFKAKTTRKKKLICASVLVINFGVLCFLKYYNMLALTFGGSALKLFLPLGISFYTFQSMGYMIDIYRKKFEPEKNPLKFLLFVSFFPQIVQGPISFYSNLAGQLYEGHDFDFDNIKQGALLIAWGFFKKMVIADTLVDGINLVANDHASFSGTYVLTAAVFYALQLYADFSGGVDISRGVSQMFGITLAENFKRPYISRSISEYWRRWHITLGAWLKEYLFYPIAMSKTFMNFSKWLKKHFGMKIAKVLPVSIASLITFIIIGIWHGANWKYAAFGIWNGGIIMFSTLLEERFGKWKTALKIKDTSKLFIAFQTVRTFLIVLVGYYFDIAPDFSSAMEMMAKSVYDFHITEYFSISFYKTLLISVRELAMVLAATGILARVSYLQETSQLTVRERVCKKGYVFESAVFVALVFMAAVFGHYGPGTNPADFYYMQF